MSMSSRLFTHFRSGLLPIVSTLALVACGGGATDPSAVGLEDPLAQRRVTVAELPALHRCLDDAVQSLGMGGVPPATTLLCAVGTYVGRTDDGTGCQLQVSGQPAQLRFSVDDQAVTIAADVAAYRPDMPPLQNIEATPLGNDRPGVMLTRYAAVERLTESIALRAGAPSTDAPSVPQLIYLRVQDGAVQERNCRFDL
jgi:hypothetical protein